MQRKNRSKWLPRLSALTNPHPQQQAPVSTETWRTFSCPLRHFNRGVTTASTPQFSDIHDYMAYHHCTVTSHKSSSVHTLVNSINYAGRRSHRCMRQKYVFSHIHLPAGLTHSLILHSSLFSKYMMHELHLHKDIHTHTQRQCQILGNTFLILSSNLFNLPPLPHPHPHSVMVEVDLL